MNTNTDFIEQYHTFNSQGCPNELIFGDRNDQPIPPGYYIFLYYSHDDSSIDNVPIYVKGVEPDNELLQKTTPKTMKK